MNTSSSGTAKTSPQNDFKPFAVGEGANVIEQSEYEKSGFLKEGFKKGMARSSEINKAIRQGSSIAAAVARFAAAKTGEALLDNGDINTLCRQIETAISSVSSLLIAEADGSADALTAHFTPTVKELENGLLVHVRAKEKNTGTSPSFNADETGEKPVVKGNNLPLEAADIAGAGHWLEMQYDGALDKWVLQNPAKGITPPSGVPVGTIEYFAMPTPPAGYLKADGAAVGRQTYPELFETIGTTFGEGDGSTTFNLPDLMDRFAQGSDVPGQKVEAGLPNITGEINIDNTLAGMSHYEGALYPVKSSGYKNSLASNNNGTPVAFDASRSNPIYGASTTVQPPALTLLPCIKAFDAATNPGLIDITELANEVATHKHVNETYNDGTNWYRKWSDGWLEQGGFAATDNTGRGVINLLQPYSTEDYTVCITAYASQITGLSTWTVKASNPKTQSSIGIVASSADPVSCMWQTCGKGMQS
ncbi:tail fiber protein [Oxalobacter formigenes]|uniref:Phage Tail Collar Domain protein n=1 Tax=Oxalobacter formigenes OXCC13 TaxID=556269 RepID=C3X9L4_OXAFO|nr:tail fiber protein [Oxalobacter formigenes]ARQ45980.1 Phage Tail Collar Domain protein [Oxalobacter formigenes]ARQ78184.1 hypothetical protein BRW84_05845 [Oxalobacter formigenes OXCC13]EEO29890.1 phage Tail Collar Domain protein [Oxalobacter formigenes OXCC13]MCZ4062112.1 phage tail protein [Oxalobacter formigenes]QDX33270.1 tail fiber protein [Oxalobacter formigenes]